MSSAIQQAGRQVSGTSLSEPQTPDLRQVSGRSGGGSDFGGSGSSGRPRQVSARSDAGGSGSGSSRRHVPPSPAKSGSTSGRRSRGSLSQLALAQLADSGTKPQLALMEQHPTSHLGLLGAVANAPTRMCTHSPLGIAVPVWRDSRFPEWERHVSYGTREEFWYNWYNGQISFANPTGSRLGKSRSRTPTETSSGATPATGGGGFVSIHEASLARAKDPANPADHSSYFEERYEAPESDSDVSDEEKQTDEVHETHRREKEDPNARTGPSYHARNWAFQDGAWWNTKTGQHRQNTRPLFLGNVWLHQ